jgi:microcystin degradation protein MlrC
MGLRIAVGGFMHETNTFVAKPTVWDDFVNAGPWPGATEGEAIFTTFRGINLAIAYFMDAAEKADHTMLPLAWAGAMPGGKVARDAFERMAGIMVERLRRERPDAIFLELHGAMVAEEYDDGEGELLRRVRETVGPDVPILISLDLHANVSPLMVATADFISSYRTYPHVDWGASGGRCAEWLDRVLAWKPRPARALRQAPFLIPVTTGCTYVEPAKGLYEELKRIEAESGVHLSLNMGFPPSDIRDVGPSVTGRNRRARMPPPIASSRRSSRQSPTSPPIARCRLGRRSPRRSALREPRRGRSCSPTRRTIPAPARHRTRRD